MSLDVCLKDKDEEVFEANITHNLNTMADKAGMYKALWRPEDIGAVWARDIIEPLEAGLKKMTDNPEYYEQFNASNGWGTYDNFLPWVAKYLHACRKHPDATLEVGR